MDLKKDIVKEYNIYDLERTVDDVAQIVNDFYDLGKVEDVKKLAMGETNFNYYLQVESNGKRIKYFAQLFSSAKTLEQLKYELSLRSFFMSNNKNLLKCALPKPNENGEFVITCRCKETNQVRFFCVFDFIEGITYDYDEWAFGKMNSNMIRGIANGIAKYHITAYDYIPPDDCRNVMTSYAEELAEYERVFTDEFEKRRTPIGKNAYYDRFAEYQPRLLELLRKYTEKYLVEKDNLPHCICHIDTSANNYIFNDEFEPIAVCDMDWSHIMPRLFDLCWLIGEGFFEYDSSVPEAKLKISDIVEFVNAYDEAITVAGNEPPGKLTSLERELLPELFQLVAIRLGLYNIWVYIMTDNPTDDVEYNLYWGNCAITEIEFVEAHMEEIKKALRN